jgi:type I restriction enzyme S subunit
MMVPSSWEIYEFQRTLVKNKVSKDNQISASDIKTSGKYPVVDQGQDYIAGYSDEKDKVYIPEQPLVIFGDHTRCFKYIDFPFIIGADGTKILAPNTTLFNPKFFYFYLLTLHIPSRGYNRHFKLLREQKILRPPIPEQQNIAHILSKIQSAIEVQEKIIQTTTKLKKAMMQKLFTEGLKGERQKKTEIGLVPENWEMVKLKEIVNFTTGKLNANQAKSDGKYPFFTCSQKTFWIDKYAFDTEAVLLSGNNARAIYSVKYFNGKFNAYQRTYVITIKDTSQFSYVFLKYILLFNLDRLRKLSIGTSTKYLTLGILENLEIIKPKIDEQENIAHTLSAVESKIESSQAKLKSFQALFNSMLHHLMTGQIRVKGVELRD